MPSGRASSKPVTQHPWESDAEEPAALAFEVASTTEPSPRWEDPPSDFDSDEEEVKSPGQQYIDFMIELVLMRNISAREFCVAMYLAGPRERIQRRALLMHNRNWESSGRRPDVAQNFAPR